tara:strand:+ start:110 stop:916 length:807 start_codon:yes stop_codon:yes gene_type:complete
MGATAGSSRPIPIEPPKPTPPPMSGGKGAGRVSPIVESRPMFSGINDINKMSNQRPGRVLTDPVPPRAGGKGGARVQPTTPQASLPEYQSVIKGFPLQSEDSVPQPTLEQQLSAPAATQEVVEKSEFPPEIKPYITDIVDKANAQEKIRQQTGTPDFNNIVETSTAVNQGTQQIPPSTGGGGKGSARVAPVTPQPMPMTPPPAPMTPPPIPPGLDNPVFRRLGQRQVAQQPQQSITGMNTNTGSTNSMPAPQSAIFKQGGLIGLMRRR